MFHDREAYVAYTQWLASNIIDVVSRCSAWLQSSSETQCRSKYETVDAFSMSALKPDTLQTLQASFLRLASDRTSSSQVFYERLFELQPSLRSLFRNDLAAQQQKLMTSLVQIMRSVEHPSGLALAIDGLAQRHLAYGARPEYFEAFGEALLWTLEIHMGPDFTPEVREAWHDTYSKVARQMTDAMLALLRRPSSGRAT